MKTQETGSINSDTTLSLDEFPGHTYEQWKDAAVKLLKGASFDKVLISPTYEGFKLNPIYRKEDLAELKHLDSLPGSGNCHRGSNASGYVKKGWLVSQFTPAATLQEFNKNLKAEISNGLTEINLSNQSLFKSIDDLKIAFKDIQLTGLSLNIPHTNTSRELMVLVLEFIKSLPHEERPQQGAFNSDPLARLAETGSLPSDSKATYDKLADITRDCINEDPWLKPIGIDTGPYANGGASASQELGYGLATALEYMRQLSERGIKASTLVSHIRFSYSIGPNFFMEIAKLRAARLLWSRLLETLDVSDQADKIFIHAKTGLTNKTRYDEAVNLLRTTTEALSATLGGCDSLTVQPFNETNSDSSELSRRVARNTHTILREECDLKRVVDPGGGSYYLETITNQLCEQAWKHFQTIEKTGGMTQALLDKLPQEAIAETAKKRNHNIATRRNSIIGSNKYPNPTETLKSTAPLSINTITEAHTAESGLKAEAIPLRRLAEDYENLRIAAEDFKTKTGKAPQILQLNIGPSRNYRIRADWTSGFLQVGGFEVLNDRDFETTEVAIEAVNASDAKIVIITSDDKTYSANTEALAKSIKETNPDVHLLLAGWPGDNESSWRGAGINDFVHVRVNTYETLKTLLSKTGAIQ